MKKQGGKVMNREGKGRGEGKEGDEEGAVPGRGLHGKILRSIR